MKEIEKQIRFEKPIITKQGKSLCLNGAECTKDYICYKLSPLMIIRQAAKEDYDKENQN